MPDSGLAGQAWFQRSAQLAGLAAILWAMTTHAGAAALHGPGLRISVVLAAASVSWLAWALLGPSGNTALLQVLTACTGVAGSVLLLLYPGLTVYWFTFWACVSAGINFSLPIGAAITGGSTAILIAGYADHRGTILGAFAAIAFVGYVLGRNRKEYVGQAREATLTAEAREREATIAERGRIARELHDVLGHSLTGVSLQIESAAAALEITADANQALSHLEHAGKLVRTGQEEAVAAVRTLREGEVTLHTMIESLVGMHRASGARIRLAVTGGPRPLDGATALALYRVAQEALTNAAKHAKGEAAEVALCYTAKTLTVCVANDTGDRAHDAVSGGHGLVGMSERMSAVGGTLSAGRIGTRWLVEAQVSA